MKEKLIDVIRKCLDSYRADINISGFHFHHLYHIAEYRQANLELKIKQYLIARGIDKEVAEKL